jgi:hypothetical protein
MYELAPVPDVRPSILERHSPLGTIMSPRNGHTLASKQAHFYLVVTSFPNHKST